MPYMDFSPLMQDNTEYVSKPWIAHVFVCIFVMSIMSYNTRITFLNIGVSYCK